MDNITSCMNYTNGSVEYEDIYNYDDVKKPYKVYLLPELMPLMGYVYPILSVFTVLANIAVICVFAKKKMRTPTSMILIALAVFDSLSCACLVPHYVHLIPLIPLKNYQQYLPYRWCVYRHYSVNLYEVTHTTSNWITVCLSIQRYIIVRLPFRAKQLCSKTTSMIAIICSFLIAVLIYLNLFLAIQINPLQPEDETGRNLTLPLGCLKNFSKTYIDILGDLKKAVTMHYLFSGILSRLLPCFLLVVMTLLLIYQLRKDKIASYYGCQEGKSSEKNKQITKYVLAVLVIFLVCELQDAVAFLIYVHELVTNQMRQILSQYADDIWDHVGIILTLVGCHSNFWIYLLMGAQFRTTLGEMLCIFVSSRKQVLDRTSTTGFTSLLEFNTKTNRRRSNHKLQLVA